MKQPSLLCRPWDITEDTLLKENNYRNETIFSLGNGYIGTRGTFEENYDFGAGNGMEGNFINGFYESEDIRYGEYNYGFPKKTQTMLNVTNAKIIRLIIDGEEFSIIKGNITEYSRNLSMKDGVLTRTCIWETSAGKKVRITIDRMVSFYEKHLLSIQYAVEPLNFSGTVSLISQIETAVLNHTNEANPLIDYGPNEQCLFTDSVSVSEDGFSLTLLSRIQGTGFWLYTGCCHRFEGTGSAALVSHDTEDQLLTLTYDVTVTEGTPAVMTKQIIYTSDKEEKKRCADEGNTLLAKSANLSFDFLKERQREFLDHFWKKTDVEINGDDLVQQGLRFNMYHILQSTGRDGITSVGAKGLSGEGYEGHCFWDTEMYIVPFYTHTYPELSRNLLMYRYHLLDAARNQARIYAHKKGALYPWRTINGDDASANYLLGGAQYHINSDIAYAVNQYGMISGDTAFMYDYGLEMLCEISRVFADVGHFCDWKGGKYVINCVTGPDEYTALVDNNFYTNLCARETLKMTFYWLDRLKKEDGKKYDAFVQKLALTSQETDLWKEIIDKMYFGYDEKLGIYTQDDTFMQKKPWDPETDNEKKQKHLYLNFHPLYVFRHQMCKQADAPLGMLLFNHLFSREELRRNYEFYEPRTLNLSSLSLCIFSIIESLLGKYDAAYKNFIACARTDLDDYHNNVYAGIHAANMAGTWMVLTYGLAGMNTTDGQLHFSPHIPETWNSYAFHIQYHGSTLHIRISRDETVYTLKTGAEVTFTHNGKSYTLTSQEPKVCIVY